MAVTQDGSSNTECTGSQVPQNSRCYYQVLRINELLKRKPEKGLGRYNFKSYSWTSLVAQRLRICLPRQGTQVQSLVQEDPTCRGAAKPLHHNYWACALGPASHNYWVPQLLSLRAATIEAHMPRSCAPQRKPPQWEACALQRRVAPARRN